MLALPPPTAITMNNTQLINDISKALREHVCLLHEIDLPCTTSWETLHRLSSGILDRPDVKAGFSEVKSFQNDEVNFYVHCL
ncbi:unnamed protein product [Bursaphelenchus okinawaensis]|uniref:Uncharacterized protein n=1 Tax=Bursaphelenchus okinawaensis TaxID=465554 RepID=A0A811JQR6_9BILA|nr:unnamed protein product [Bursaphelenchus okinawaensis]CAG9078969.1 unnamed protein product [Bursaphelenchus okinawaensis]